MQYKNPRNRQLVIEALQKAGRMDLVGSDSRCLIYVDQGRPRGRQGGQAQRSDRRGSGPARGKGARAEESSFTRGERGGAGRRGGNASGRPAKEQGFGGGRSRNNQGPMSNNGKRNKTVKGR